MAKIADFGLSRRMVSKYNYAMPHKWQLNFPWRFTAPELVARLQNDWGEPTIQADIWSYGVFIFEILSYGTRPFKQIENKQEVNIIYIAIWKPDSGWKFHFWIGWVESLIGICFFRSVKTAF